MFFFRNKSCISVEVESAVDSLHDARVSSSATERFVDSWWIPKTVCRGAKNAKVPDSTQFSVFSYAFCKYQVRNIHKVPVFLKGDFCLKSGRSAMWLSIRSRWQERCGMSSQGGLDDRISLPSLSSLPWHHKKPRCFPHRFGRMHQCEAPNATNKLTQVFLKTTCSCVGAIGFNTFQKFQTQIHIFFFYFPKYIKA